MGIFVKALARAQGHECWNCSEIVHELTNKVSPLGREWGLICNGCGKDLVDWYLLNGFVKVSDVIKAEQRGRVRNARIERNIARARSGNQM